MGYFELANMLGSSLLGAVLTIWKQRLADDQERFKMALQGFKATEESQSSRLAFRSDKGFHLTRRIIALMVITTLVCGPVVFPLMVTDLAIVSFGYHSNDFGEDRVPLEPGPSVLGKLFRRAAKLAYSLPHQAAEVYISKVKELDEQPPETTEVLRLVKQRVRPDIFSQRPDRLLGRCLLRDRSHRQGTATRQPQQALV